MKQRGTYLVPTTAVIFETGEKPIRQGFDETVIRRNLANVQPREVARCFSVPAKWA
jgi:hypothetical protein